MEGVYIKETGNTVFINELILQLVKEEVASQLNQIENKSIKIEAHKVRTAAKRYITNQLGVN